MTREKVITQYYLYCPICKKEISGRTAEQVDGNLKQHLETHPEGNELIKIKVFGEAWNKKQMEKK